MKVKILLTIFATIVISLAISNSVQAGVECSGWSCEGDKGVRTCTDSETGETWKEQNDLAECKGNNPDGDPNKCPTNEGDVTCREGKAYQCIQGTWERDSEYDSNCESGDDTNTWCPNGQRRCFNDELKECKGKWVGENWTNSWVTIGTCNNDSDNNNTTPATKSCSVSLANSSPTISAGTKVTVNFNGVTPSSTLDYVKVKIKKADGSKISPIPALSTEEVISGKYYYDFPENKCSTSNSQYCSGYVYINYPNAPLPSGNYQALCDISGTQNSTTFTITGGQATEIPPFSGPISPSVLPGSGQIQGQTNFVYGNYMLQTFFKSNKGYTRVLPLLSSGIPNYSCNTGACRWSDGVELNIGSGDIQAYDVFLSGPNKVTQVVWRGDKGYIRDLTVNVANNTINFSNAQAWSEPFDYTGLPGSKSISAQTHYHHSGGYLVQTVWRGDEGFYRKVPTNSNKQVDWGNAGSWSQLIPASSIKGTGNVIAQSNTELPNNQITEAYWREDGGYARTRTQTSVPDPTTSPETTPSPTPTDNSNLDVNKDGKVDILDIIDLIKYIFGG